MLYAGQVKKVWNFDKEATQSQRIDLVIDLTPFGLLDPKLLLKDAKLTVKDVLVAKKVVFTTSLVLKKVHSLKLKYCRAQK